MKVKTAIQNTENYDHTKGIYSGALSQITINTKISHQHRP